MTEKPEFTQPPDPFENLIKFYEAWSKNWSQMMSDAATSERFSEAMGKQMEAGLASYAEARKGFGGWMETYLREMNLPTRDEMAGLAGRLAAMEIKLDDHDAKLDELLYLAKRSRD
jgi:hypothetical protein